MLGAALSGARFWRRVKTSSMVEEVARLVTMLTNNMSADLFDTKA